MSISKHNKKTAYLLKKKLGKNRILADMMRMKLEEHLNEARTELANCRLRVQNISLLIEQGERWGQRFESLVKGVPVPLHRRGLTSTIRGIIDGSPSETFTTAKIRLILKDQGFDTASRNFHSSLSTALTRLGELGFITIAKDDAGIRVYQRKGTTT